MQFKFNDKTPSKFLRSKQADAIKQTIMEELTFHQYLLRQQPSVITVELVGFKTPYICKLNFFFFPRQLLFFYTSSLREALFLQLKKMFKSLKTDKTNSPKLQSNHRI